MGRMITVDLLESLGACTFGIERFQEKFGGATEVETNDSDLMAIKFSQLEYEWAADFLLTYVGRREYRKARRDDRIRRYSADDKLRREYETAYDDWATARITLGDAGPTTPEADLPEWPADALDTVWKGQEVAHAKFFLTAYQEHGIGEMAPETESKVVATADGSVEPSSTSE